MEASLLDKGGGPSSISYAQNVAGSTRAIQDNPRKLLDRNVIIVKITQDTRRPTLPVETFETLCNKLHINIETDIERYQVIYNHGDLLVEIWLKHCEVATSHDLITF